MPDGDTAAVVTNALRTFVPELLALSANSPFWQARETGLASTRSKVFDTMPRTGIPPRFDTFAEFVALVESGTRAGFFDDYTYIWWDVRPHPKLGTVELRAFDAQTRIESVGALVALAQSLAATVVDASPAPQPRTLIAENRWRAARYGLEAELVDLASGRVRPARDAIRELLELAAPAAERLGCAAELEEVDRLCERGSGADEQRRLYDQEGSLLAVAKWLAATTVADLAVA
jgi:carboxylate-amine ligase